MLGDGNLEMAYSGAYNPQIVSRMKIAPTCELPRPGNTPSAPHRFQLVLYLVRSCNVHCCRGIAIHALVFEEEVHS